MSKSGIEKGVEVAHKIAAEPTVALSPIGSLATEWASRMDTEPSIQRQQAVTEGYLVQAMPDGASPIAILRGDYGKEAQLAFLDGALTAAGIFLES